MTKNSALKAMCLVVVTVLMASPVMGAVCTMSCGDTGSCCCSGTVAAGEPALSAPGCCEGEFEPAVDRDVRSDRHFSSFRFGIDSAPAAVVFGRFDEYRGAEPDQPLYLADPGPSPAPLFVLNASFLI